MIAAMSSAMRFGPLLNGDSPRHSSSVGAFCRVSSLVWVDEAINSSSRLLVGKVTGTVLKEQGVVGVGEIVNGRVRIET